MESGRARVEQLELGDAAADGLTLWIENRQLTRKGMELPRREPHVASDGAHRDALMGSWR